MESVDKGKGKDNFDKVVGGGKAVGKGNGKVDKCTGKDKGDGKGVGKYKGKGKGLMMVETWKWIYVEGAWNSWTSGMDGWLYWGGCFGDGSCKCGGYKFGWYKFVFVNRQYV